MYVTFLSKLYSWFFYPFNWSYIGVYHRLHSNISNIINVTCYIQSVGMLQVLRTSVFYKCWVAFFNCTIITGILMNYSKTFGLTLINDDSYHAVIGLISNLFNGLSRICWGLLYDRYTLQLIRNIAVELRGILLFN